jgi:Cu-processing system permease protein
MNTTAKIAHYELRDVLRSRWLIAYGLFFLAATDGLLRFSGSDAKALLSLMTIVLLLIPLVTIVFGTMYLYNAREFTELLLAQPVRRRELFAGQYLGLALPLSIAFLLGIGIPFALSGIDDTVQHGTLGVLAACGVGLTLVFTAIAFLIANRTDDKVKGLGVAIAVWLGFSVLYDGLVLLVLVVFASHPIERPALALMMANPIDLARVLILLRFDVSALMGYTGAVFEKFFGSAGGTALATLALMAWASLTLVFGMRRFQKKDF